MRYRKLERVRTCLIFLFGIWVVAVSSKAQGVVFESASLPRQIRGEGITETVGEVTLQNTSPGGVIPAGSSITIVYSARITNTPGAANVTCVIGGAPVACSGAISVSVSGSALTISFNSSSGALPVGAVFIISGIRVDVSPVTGSGTINANLAGVSSQPATNPVTFTQPVVPVGSVILPSLTAILPSTASGTPAPPLSLLACVIGPGAGSVFHIAVTESFPAALTTVLQESAFSSTPIPGNGSQIRVRFIGVPQGLQITANAPAAPTAPALLTVGLDAPFPVGITSTSEEDVVFTYTVAASNSSLAETVVLPFSAGLPSSTSGTLSPLGETVIVLAEVALAPVDDTRIVRFATNTQSTGPGFTLALSPSSRTVAAGGAVTYTVAINSLRGFSGQVSLFCRGMLVAGAGCGFSPDRAPPGNVVMTLATSSFTPAGTYNFRVYGVSGFLANFATASLTVTSPGTAPAFTADSVTSAASFVPGVTAGSIVTVFGTGLTRDVTGVVVADKLPLPNQLKGTSVTLNGLAAPLFAVTNANGQEQINLQVPYELTGQPSVILVVHNNGASSASVQLPLLPAHPGVFTVDGTNGAILHGSDFRLVSSSNPAAKGEVVILYATGLGPISPAPPAGMPALGSPLSMTAVPPTVMVGGVVADVLFSGLAPGFVGLYQVNIRIPESVPSGSLDVLIQAGGQTSKVVKMAVL